MDEQLPRDRRVENVKDRLQDDLVDDQGQPADPGEVERAVDAAAAPFADAPVQEFTPLLIEHQARDTLHEQGFHREVGDEEQAEYHPPHDDETPTDADAVHLATQQGTAAPDPD